MTHFNFKHVCIEAMVLSSPPIKVASSELEDRLAPLYQRLSVPFGTLEKLSGVRSRNFWDGSMLPSKVATLAATQALDESSFSREHIGAIFNCSVTRDYFEPATSCLIHRNLGLGEYAMAMDISNACIGFSNGILMVANMIERGIIKAGLVTSGEIVERVIDAHIRHLLAKEDITREQLLKLLPSFTLGSGAVAFVLCHESLSTKGHKLLGSVARSATQFSELCMGNADYVLSQRDFNPLMETESSKLITSAATLGGRMWADASEAFNWSKQDIDHIFCHQVGKQVNQAFYEEMGLEMEKEFTIYKDWGNLISAALPACLVIGSKQKNIKPRDKVLLTAFGSGLNSIFTAIEW
jgi:3-oxoacyl-[acyl-carrier-protein] synthase-3